MTSGSTRSLSVIAKPQVGKATQAIDHRRTVEISSDSGSEFPFDDRLELRSIPVGDVGKQDALMGR